MPQSRPRVENSQMPEVRAMQALVISRMATALRPLGVDWEVSGISCVVIVDTCGLRKPALGRGCKFLVELGTNRFIAATAF